MTLFNLFGLFSHHTTTSGTTTPTSTPPAIDTAVDGEATGEVMGLGYDDSNAPTDQGGQVITNDGDLIIGNGGDDTIDGAGGNDTILGDSATDDGGSTHEMFSWADAPNFGDNNNANSFSQDTGNANITFTIVAGGDATNEYDTETQNTDDLDAAVDENASFESVMRDNGDSAEYTWESDVPLENVEFRVNDIDGDGLVRIEAYDADGNQIEVILSNAGDHLDLSNEDTIAGNDTATHNHDDDYAPDSDPAHSVLVTIPGPVSEFRLIHEMDGNDDSGVNITDITFDAVTFDPGAAGDDSIDGGDGEDLIFGQEGGDTIDGGTGDDVIYGDSGDSASAGGPGVPGDTLGDGPGSTGGGYDVIEQTVYNGNHSFSTDAFYLGNDIPVLDDANRDAITGVSFSQDGEGTDRTFGLDELEFTGAQRSLIGLVTVQDSDVHNANDQFSSSISGGFQDTTVVSSGTADFIDTEGREYDGIRVNFVRGPDGETYMMPDDGPSPGAFNAFRNMLAQNEINGTGIKSFTIATGSGDDSGINPIEGNWADGQFYEGTDGDGGDDVITGGEGADSMFGEGGDDTFIVDNAADADGDVISGGNGPDETTDNDTLDLRGAGPVTITDAADANDDGATTGTVTFADGSTLDFEGIETILTDPGIVDGEETGENMGPGYDDALGATDGGGDQIDGADGDDDTIEGNGGDDTIDSGAGDDTVDGGSGDDDFVLTGGIDNDDITGGETGETDGDTLDASAVGDDLTLDISAPEEGTLTDGDDTTEFEEIEQFVLGGGDDTVTGSTGGDTVDGGGGNNEMDGGEGDDSLTGGGGNDTITGGDGSDTVIGGSGDNVIDTSGGDPRPDLGYPGLFPADTDPDDDRDLVVTTFGDDSITTGDDADTIISGSGHDTIDAGLDADEIEAGAGDDYIIAGEGSDDVDGGSGNDTIYGGLAPGAPDALNITDEDTGGFSPDLVPDNGKDTLDGGKGNDLIYGADDDDLIIGGGGADTLDGGIDDDTITGDAGKDEIIGGQGADSMSGGDDRDTFHIDTREDAFGDTIDGGTGGNDVDTLDLTGLGKFEIVGQTTDADGDSTSGTVNFLASDGSVEGTLQFGEIEKLIICFTPGSRIATPRGEIEVQDLKAGDRVITRDDGVQEINWIGRKKLTAAELIADPKLRPVLIRKGSLGNNLPERDMMVSPNHRMLMANSQTQVLFDEREVLVAAKHLVGQPGVHQVDTLGTEYIHVMFERHEVILGDGAWTESFQPGDHSLSGIDAEQRDEIFKLFPDLQRAEGRRSYSSARQSLKAHEARMLRQSMGVN